MESGCYGRTLLEFDATRISRIQFAQHYVTGKYGVSSIAEASAFWTVLLGSVPACGRNGLAIFIPVVPALGAGQVQAGAP